MSNIVTWGEKFKDASNLYVEIDLIREISEMSAAMVLYYESSLG